jgi:hypothetical protein
VPRCTAVLRSTIFTSPSSSNTADQLFVERAKTLGMQGSTEPNAAAGPHLLGDDHTKAPRAARSAHAAFTTAVTSALGTDAAGEELAAYITETYNALAGGVAAAEGLRCILGTVPAVGQFAVLQSTFQALQQERWALGLADTALSDITDTGTTEAREWRPPPGLPAIVSATLSSPRSAMLRLCNLSAASTAMATLDPSTLATSDASSSSAVPSSLWNSSSVPAAAEPSRAPVPRPHNAIVDPDSDDEVMGTHHATATLTWLQNLFCGMTGQSPPSRGGDDTVLLLILQVLVNQPDGDAAADELLNVMGFDHVDEVSRIVAVRPVRYHRGHCTWLENAVMRCFSTDVGLSLAVFVSVMFCVHCCLQPSACSSLLSARDACSVQASRSHVPTWETAWELARELA